MPGGRPNVLVIMADEHSRQVASCYGHAVVDTPNLDMLADSGTLFEAAYTPSPLCVPARAAFYTGRHVHRLGTWDNATPHNGTVPGLGDILHDNGMCAVSFGKLDFRSDTVYRGLRQVRPLHRSVPDIGGLLRGIRGPRPGFEKRFHEIGNRDDGVTTWDDTIRDEALEWIGTSRATSLGKPWIALVNFNDPHFPLFVKNDLWEKYDMRVVSAPSVAIERLDELNLPLQQLRDYFSGQLADEEVIRRAHVGYYAAVEEMDNRVGAVLKALDDSGQRDETLVIYTSDHGEMLGHHGLWWKCCMYEESAGIPLIISGPGIGRGVRVDSPVSLIDVFPTICALLGTDETPDVDGTSLVPLLQGKPEGIARDFAFSEYHGHGVSDAMYMIRWHNWKYIHYIAAEPQVYNLRADPEELDDLWARRLERTDVLEAIGECRRRLESVCNPIQIDRCAKAFQERWRARLGVSDYCIDEKDLLGSVPWAEPWI